MDQSIRKAERTEELHGLTEKWERRLYPIFLELGLDIREFWRRWDTGSDKDAREGVRDLKTISEMVTVTMHKAIAHARPESLEALADDNG